MTAEQGRTNLLTTSEEDETKDEEPHRTEPPVTTASNVVNATTEQNLITPTWIHDEGNHLQESICSACCRSCSPLVYFRLSQSNDDDASAAFWIFGGPAYLVGTVLGVLRASLELESAWRNRRYGGYDDDDVDDDEWIYADLFFHWSVLKVLDVSSTFLYLVSAIAEISLERSDSRTTFLDWMTTFLFGSGALLDLSSSAFSDIDDSSTLTKISYGSESWSAYLFFSSAVVLMLAHSKRYYRDACVQRVAVVILVADLLFFAGTSVDVLYSFLDKPNETNREWLRASVWGLISAICWLLNATLETLVEWMLEVSTDNAESSSNSTNVPEEENGDDASQVTSVEIGRM